MIAMIIRVTIRMITRVVITMIVRKMVCMIVRVMGVPAEAGDSTYCPSTTPSFMSFSRNCVSTKRTASNT